MKSQYYRTCRVHEGLQGPGEYDAIFHRFERDTGIVVQEDSAGTPHSAIVTRVVGIVERTDGQIVLVEPEQIRFMDGFAERVVRRCYERMDGYEEA